GDRDGDSDGDHAGDQSVHGNDAGDGDQPPQRNTALPSRPTSDAHEALWRTYYRSICNVSRINPRTMQREMPQRYWRNMPETTEILTLVREGLEKFSQRH